MSEDDVILAWLADPVTAERLESALSQQKVRIKSGTAPAVGERSRLLAEPRTKLHPWDAARVILWILREDVL